MNDDMKLLQRLADCGGMEMEFLELKRDAERWRWWRNRWPALCRMEVARFAGLDLTRTYVQSPEDMDAVTDAAMQAP